MDARRLVPAPAPMRRSAPFSWNRSFVVVGALAVALLVAVVGLLFMSTRAPHFVGRLSVVNPTAYQLDVEATDGGRHGWTSAGIVGPRTTEGFEDVVDQGDRWILRFSYGGQTAGELALSGKDLERAKWRVEVPSEFGEKLRAAGINPPPG